MADPSIFSALRLLTDTKLLQLPRKHPGLLVPGNIDLARRPVVHNQDGSISTVRSVTFTLPDGRALLLPTVVGNQVVSPQQALLVYQHTGKHLGVFANEKAADKYAQSLHREQAVAYGK